PSASATQRASPTEAATTAATAVTRGDRRWRALETSSPVDAPPLGRTTGDAHRASSPPRDLGSVGHIEDHLRVVWERSRSALSVSYYKLLRCPLSHTLCT